jgi:hypothetical protein
MRSIGLALVLNPVTVHKERKMYTQRHTHRGGHVKLEAEVRGQSTLSQGKESWGFLEPREAGKKQGRCF